ncbi:MAG: hypothetical protein FWD53_08950 [Phycisphaerales bacterium]|nr:hypothetical protein [Phycisphaerales bacterium]
MRKFCSFVVVTMLVLIGFTQVVKAGGPLDSRIPPDAIVYVGWQGTANLADDYAKSNLKSILDNSKLPQYVAENWPTWMSKFKEEDEDAAEKFQQASIGLDILWRRGGALYVGPVGFADPGKPKVQFAVLCDAGEDAAKLENWAKELIAKASPSDDFKPVVHRNGTLVILTVADVKPESFFRNDGGLAATAAYKAANAPLMKDRSAAVYVDVQKAIAAFEEGARVDPSTPEEIKKNIPILIKALGLNGLNQFAYGGAMDGKEWAEQAFLGTKAPRTGALAFLDVQPVSDDALKMVPKDAAAMTIGRFDLTKLLTLIRDVISQVDPEGVPKFDSGFAMGKLMFGVDFEKEFLNTFGDEWVFYRGPQAESGTCPFVVINKLRNTAALTTTLVTLGAKVNEMGGGIQIEKMDTGTFEVTGVRLPEMTIVWTARDGFFYVSTLEGISAAVEQVEKKGEPILANASFTKLRAALPAVKPISITYSNPAKLYTEALTNMLPLAEMAELELPADLLPPLNKIAPFLTPGGSVSWTDANGLHISSRWAFPGAAMLSR